MGEGVTVTPGPWSGFLWLEDGTWQYRQEGDSLKVWHWDGKQMRRVKHFPEHVHTALEMLIGGTYYAR